MYERETIVLELSRWKGEKCAAFADRAFTLLTSLNILSRTPIDVNINSKQGIARFYYRRRR